MNEIFIYGYTYENIYSYGAIIALIIIGLGVILRGKYNPRFRIVMSYCSALLGCIGLTLVIVSAIGVSRGIVIDWYKSILPLVIAFITFYAWLADPWWPKK